MTQKATARRVTIASAIVVGITALAMIVWSTTRPRPFDRNIWAMWSVEATGYALKSPRRDMSDEVIEVLLRKRMSRSDVLQLLGTPEEGGSDQLWYYIGPDSDRKLSILPGYAFLRIEFDSHGCVATAVIVSSER